MYVGGLNLERRAEPRAGSDEPGRLVRRIFKRGVDVVVVSGRIDGQSTELRGSESSTHLSVRRGLAEKESNRRCARFWHPLRPQTNSGSWPGHRADARLRLRPRAAPRAEPGGTSFGRRLP